MTLLSIITVVKNNSEEILNTLESINNQNYDDFEYIIIDSNSNDGTSEIIKNFKFNKKFKYLREKDNGIYQGLNKGIRLSMGKFISVLHSGDFFYSDNTLGNIVSQFNDNDIIFGDIAYYKDLKINRIWKFRQSNKEFINPFKIAHTSLFVKKKLFNTKGFYKENFKISSDFDFLLRIKREKLKFVDIPNIIIFMKSGGKSFSFNNFFLKMKEDLNILFYYFNFLFVIFYLYKLFIKIKSLRIFLNKQDLKILEKQLKNKIKRNLD